LGTVNDKVVIQNSEGMRKQASLLVAWLSVLLCGPLTAAMAQSASAGSGWGCADIRSVDSGTLLLGELQEPKSDRQALLFCTDKNGNITAMFEPPNFLAIEQRMEGEVIRLQSEKLSSGRFYVFAGRKSGQTLTGKMELRTDAGPVFATAPATDLTLRTIRDLLDSHAGPRPKLSHYSSMKFIEESGDIIGSEIWIASHQQKAIGFIVFYDSYWGDEVIQRPLVMDRLRRTANGWSFEIESFGIQGRKTAKYRLQSTRDGATLERLGVEKEGRSPIRMKAKPKLGQAT
jgi:hypothetical protein